MDAAIVWFRQDLRLGDNPALYHAAKHARRLILVYIHSPQEHGPWAPGAANRWWLHHSLQALQTQAQSRGGQLLILRGDSAKELLRLVADTGAQAVYANHVYEPALAARDDRAAVALRQAGVEFCRYHGSLLLPPDSLSTQKGSPLKVFTPFWKKHQQLYIAQKPLNAPSSFGHAETRLHSVPLADLGLRPRIQWYQGLEDNWQPGEPHAVKTLKRFMQSALHQYQLGRDLPAEDYTSCLSPYLHFGEISPRQVHWQITQAQQDLQPGQYAQAETYLKELTWREFAYYILHHFPHTADQPLDRRFEKFPYIKTNTKLLRAWQTGATGYPLVDAGMRQLWHTGWMHNRVRMLVASFLTKNCLTSWLEGARWFWDTLVDADLASNSFNWQWCAGCGADAAPYFRIFNPVTQSRKFDPQGHYIKAWLPELRSLPDEYLHEPWTAPPAVQRQANIRIGTDYPLPVLDLKHTRQRALDSYRQFTKSPSAK